MRTTGRAKKTVWRWRTRFREAGVAGLLRDATRPPGKAPVPADRTAEIVRLTQAPPHEATHWTARAMAKTAYERRATISSAGLIQIKKDSSDIYIFECKNVLISENDIMTFNWKTGGLALGLVFFLAVLLVKPIGVSTQFVILDGILWDKVSPNVISPAEDGYTSTNAYLAKSGGKYAAAVANPINYSFVVVLAMLAGGALSAWFRGGIGADERRLPALWRGTFGDSAVKRYLAAFLGGVVVLYGARLAGGCTSGHMMSGMMQTALSGFIFAAGAFAAAVPTAMMLYRKEP